MVCTTSLSRTTSQRPESSSSRRPRRRTPGRKSLRPRIDALEPRILLATVTWVASGNGFWDVGSNWSTGTVPGPGDDVNLDGLAGQFTITYRQGGDTIQSIRGSQDALVLSGGSLTISAASQLDSAFTMSGGTLNANGGLTLTSKGSQWTDGVVNGTLTNAGVMTLSGPADKTVGGLLQNAGSIVQSGLGRLRLGYPTGIAPATGRVSNLAGAVYDFQVDTTIFQGGGPNTGAFDNAGTLRKSGGTGTSTVAVLFNNAAGGAIDVGSGTLVLAAGGSSQGGTFDVAQGGTLDLTGGNTNNLTGTYTGSGGGTVQMTGGTLNVSSATFNLPDSMFQWTGGLIQGTLTNAGVMTLSGTADKTVGGLLQNAGSIVQSGPGRLRLGYPTGIVPATGRVSNLAGAVYDLQVDTTIFHEGGPDNGAFDNAGTLRKSGGTGTSTVDVLFNNAAGGAIDVGSGTLVLAGGGSSQGGTFDVAQGGTLDLTGGNTNNLTGTYTGSGGGTVQMTGGMLNVSSATFNLPDSMFQWTGGLIQGTLTNAGVMTLSGPADKTVGGLLQNAGSIVQSGLGRLQLGYPTGIVPATGQLSNLAGAIYEFRVGVGTAPLSIFAVGGPNTGTFDNAGTFCASAGAGSLPEVAVPVNNTGTVEVVSGTLSLIRDIAQVSGSTLTGGTWTVHDGATLDLSSAPPLTANQGTVTLDGPGSSFPAINSLASNAGSFHLLGGRSFTTTGDLSNTGTLNVGPGSTLTVNGAYTQAASGTLEMQVGGPPSGGQFGQLAVTGQATLGGTLDVTLANGFGPTAGQTFPIVSYAGHTGDFAAINGLTSGRTRFFTESTNPTNVMLNAVTSAADLAVNGIDPLSPTATVGQDVTVSYPSEPGRHAGQGSWVDSVYLTTDGQFDTSSVLLGRVTHTGDVAGQPATRHADRPAAGVLGQAQVVVVVDSRGMVPDAGPGEQRRHFPVDPSGGRHDPGQRDAVQRHDRRRPGRVLPTRRARRGSRADHTGRRDRRSPARDPPWRLTQRLDLRSDRLRPDADATADPPARRPGRCRVHLGAWSGRIGGGETLHPLGPGVAVPGPRHQPATRRAGHRHDHRPWLAAHAENGRQPGRRGQSIAATSISYQDSGMLYATFDLSQVSIGTYNVAIADGGRTSTSSQVFQVDPANYQGFGSFDADTNAVAYSLTGPANTRAGLTSVLTIDYTNTVNVDIPAPILVLSSDNAEFQLPGQTDFTPDAISLLAINQDGPAGTLPPGYHGQINVTVRAQESTAPMSLLTSISRTCPPRSSTKNRPYRTG